jgi:hypothetical protein
LEQRYYEIAPRFFACIFLRAKKHQAERFSTTLAHSALQAIQDATVDWIPAEQSAAIAAFFRTK